LRPFARVYVTIAALFEISRQIDEIECHINVFWYIVAFLMRVLQ